MASLEMEKEVEDLVKEVAAIKNILNYTFQSEFAVEKGDNFLGDILKATIKDLDNKTDVDLIMKLSFKDEKVRKEHPISNFFENETHFYSEVFPRLKNFQKSKIWTGVFDNVPKCYLARTTIKHEAIVMENLMVQGYEIFPKHLVLDDEHLKALFILFGRFHALTFAYQDQNPKEFQNVTSKIKNVIEMIFGKEHFQKTVNMFAKQVYDVIEDKKIKTKFENYVKNSSKMFNELAVQWGGPYTTIVHSDSWSNNFMFKYDKSKKLKDIKILDWQLYKIGSPVYDLSYMFYSGGAKEKFDKLDDYLAIYYQSFSEFAKALGSDPFQLYPFEILKEHWKQFSRYGLLWSFLTIRNKLTHRDNVADLKDLPAENGDLDMSKVKCDQKEYDKRIRDLICHLDEIGVL